MECDGEVMEWRSATAAQMFSCFFVLFLQSQMEDISVETQMYTHYGP